MNQEIKIPCFSITQKAGDSLRAQMPSKVAIKLQPPTTQNRAISSILDMTATAEARKSRIAWVNNTGPTNDYFVLQKLNPATGEFEDIVTINSRSAEGPEHYTSYDNDPVVGDNTYRIKLVQADGLERYSDAQIVQFFASESVILYPNPADDLLNIGFKGYLGQAVDLTFSDMQGKTLFKQHIDKLPNEVQTLVIADKLSVGTYMIHVQSAGKRNVVKVFTVGK